MILFGATAASLICVLALVLGDRTLRLGAGLSLLAWGIGVGLQLAQHDLGAKPLLLVDVVYTAALAVLFRLSPFRVWLAVALTVQGLMIVLQLTAVEIDGQRFHGYALQYDVLNDVLLAAFACGIAAHVLGRRRGRRSLAAPALQPHFLA